MEHAHIRTVMAAYEVAIAHALLSQSGCAAVTNGQNAVLLRVHACVHDAKRIVVSVSRAFGGRGMVHALAGLVGLGVQLGGELGREEDVRECAVRVGNVHTEFFFDRFAKERGGRRLRLGFQRGGGVTDGIIDKLLMEHCGVIGMGRSGVVLRSAFGKMNVAVKYWNEVDMDGLVELLDEIGVYRHLSEKFEEIVGVAVATPLVMRCEPKAEAMLVTEYVGSGLRRGKNGRLCMGDGDVWEEIADEDICEIRCAALNSLSLLHDCRVAHGDVALRNVRVRRTDDENKWMAWWIDLGHAEDECEDECSFEFDRFRFEQCFANSDALQEEEGGLFDL